ncbi:MAG TPA: hypothetical protein VGL88_03805 [Pseudonocardiaceae bacterium]|jgi:uncharacterized membrane protein YczE
MPWQPLPRQLGLRLVQLLAGLVLYGISMALMIRSQLGNMPWDVLHQGLARHLGHSIGTVTVAVGVIVLLAWIPLREKPGIGTVCNVVVIGFSVDAALRMLPAVGSLPLRGLLAGAGVLLNAVATAAYIGVRLGPGPRDGLMTGLVRRTGGSLRLVRTAIEVAVVATGWALGGTLGIATLAYALAIGPLVQLFLPRVLFKDYQPAVATPSTAANPVPPRTSGDADGVGALTPEDGHSSAGGSPVPGDRGCSAG